MTIRALIVDDEPLARRRLRLLLKDEPDLEVAAECEDGPSAIAAIRRLAPDLLLLDVQMPGMSGFDVLAEIRTSAAPAVIFVTAYDRHAIRAFEFHAVDYLLKPFERDRLRQAVLRARKLLEGTGDVARRLLTLLSDPKLSRYLERFAVKSRGRVYFVRVPEIDWIEAAGHYLALHVGPEAHLIRETMAVIEKRLDPSRFLRVHRSVIVNIDRIEQMRPAFHGEYEISLRNGARVNSGRGYSEVLRNLARSG